jgi:hypothetical protein
MSIEKGDTMTWFWNSLKGLYLATLVELATMIGLVHEPFRSMLWILLINKLF